MKIPWELWTDCLKAWLCQVVGAFRRKKGRDGYGVAFVFPAPQTPEPAIGADLVEFRHALQTQAAHSTRHALEELERVTDVGLAMGSCRIVATADREPVLGVVLRSCPALGPPGPLRRPIITAMLVWWIERVHPTGSDDDQDRRIRR